MIPDVPGRGAWTQKGGLLPYVSSTGTLSKSGYYRKNRVGETQVGSGWYHQTDKSDSAHAVFLGVKAIQHQLNVQLNLAIPEIGLFGPATEAGVKMFQTKMAMLADGVVGRGDAIAIFQKPLNTVCSYTRVPHSYLCGLVNLESGYEPGAVGVNGWDHGLCQINYDVHLDEMTYEQGMDPVFCLDWTARHLRSTYDKWVGKTTANPWDIAIANHNSPALALQWAQTGVAPVVSGRSIQIADYVTLVKKSCPHI